MEIEKIDLKRIDISEDNFILSLQSIEEREKECTVLFYMNEDQIIFTNNMTVLISVRISSNMSYNMNLKLINDTNRAVLKYTNRIAKELKKYPAVISISNYDTGEIIKQNMILEITN